MNAYERRKLDRQDRARLRRRKCFFLCLLSKDRAERMYEEAFELCYGFKPKHIPRLPPAKLYKVAERLYATAHERSMDDGVS